MKHFVSRRGYGIAPTLLLFCLLLFGFMPIAAQAAQQMVTSSGIYMNLTSTTEDVSVSFTTSNNAVVYSGIGAAIKIETSDTFETTIVLENINLAANGAHVLEINGNGNCTVMLAGDVQLTSMGMDSHGILYTGTGTLTIAGEANDGSTIRGDYAILSYADLAINGSIGDVSGNRRALSADKNVLIQPDARIGNMQGSDNSIFADLAFVMEPGAIINTIQPNGSATAGIYTAEGDIIIDGTIHSIRGNLGLCAAAHNGNYDVIIGGTIGSITAETSHGIAAEQGSVTIREGAAIGKIISQADGIRANGSVMLEAGASIDSILSQQINCTGIYTTAGDIVLAGSIPNGISAGFGLIAENSNVRISGTVGAIKATFAHGISTPKGCVIISGKVEEIAFGNAGKAVDASQYAILDYGIELDTDALSPSSFTTIQFVSTRNPKYYIGPDKAYISDPALTIPEFVASSEPKRFIGWYTEEALKNEWDFNTAIDHLPSHTLYAKWRANQILPPPVQNKTDTATANIKVNGAPMSVPYGTSGLPEVKLSASLVQHYRVTGERYDIDALEHTGMLLDIDVPTIGEQALILHTNAGTVTIPATTLAVLQAQHGNTLRLRLTDGAIRIALLDASYEEIEAGISMPYTITLTTPSADANNNNIVAVKVGADDKILPFALYRNDASTFWTFAPGTYVLMENGKYFIDTEAHWAMRDIACVTARELFLGTATEVFSPDATMTRAMFATVLWRLDGQPEATHAPNFTDVNVDTWYTQAVAWAAENAILEGYGNGLFGADDAITREQMAALLERYIAYRELKLQAPEAPSRPSFVDKSSISTWATQSTQAMHAAGLIQGHPNGSFCPQGLATRAEVCAIFTRLIEAAQ